MKSDEHHTTPSVCIFRFLEDRKCLRRASLKPFYSKRKRDKVMRSVHGASRGTHCHVIELKMVTRSFGQSLRRLIGEQETLYTRATVWKAGASCSPGEFDQCCSSRSNTCSVEILAERLVHTHKRIHRWQKLPDASSSQYR